jgi:hypothetical protein
MKIKIAEIADIHFGVSSAHTIRTFENLEKNFIGWLKKNNPDVNIIAICGDLFHLKLSLNSTEAKMAIGFIDRLVSEFPNARIIIIKGTRSHDLDQLEILSSRCNENFKIYNTVCDDYYGKDFHYLVIPEEYYPDKSVYDKYLKTTERYDWGFFHGLFTFAGSYALQNNIKIHKISFNSKEFDNIIMGKFVGGHIHMPMEENKVQYCGSFQRWRHGEEEDKGFRYHEYDTETKKIIKDEFIVNTDAFTYKTLSFNKFDTDNLENLIKQLHDESSKCTALRIKIFKSDTITDNQASNLVAACTQFNNVSIYKEAKTIDKSKSEEDKKLSEERKQRIKEYDGLSFNEITIKYANEVLHRSITDEQIAEILSI